MTSKLNTPPQADNEARNVGRRTFLKMMAAGAAASALAACAAGAPAEVAAPAAAPTAVPTPEAVAGAGMMRPEGNPIRGGTLRTAFGVTMSHFDAHQGGGTHVLSHMYNNLVRNNLVDGLRTIIPDLAESWEVGEGGLSYTFALREGVTYHDGEAFSAQDVVATFNRILDPPEGIVSPLKANFTFVDSVEAVDDMTVRFNLNSPRPFFLNLLTPTNALIYSKKSLEEHNYDLREVIAPGTGAFRFVDHLPAEKWILEANPDYWDPELPYVDGIELLHVPAWSDRGTAVLTDQADMSWNVAKETWDEGKNRPESVQANQLANFGAYWVFINNRESPFDDARVRKAIHLAVSKHNLAAAFGTQELINITRWVPQGDPYATTPEELSTMPGYRADKEEDIATAQQLMADAGYGDGLSGVELLAAAGPQGELLAPAFQDMLKRHLNIETEIRIVERALLGSEQQSGNYQLMVHTRGHSVSDISPRGNLWWATGGSQNFGGYSNPDFDALLATIDVELDVETRTGQIADAQNMLDENPPEYLVGYTYHLPMWNNRVHGLALDRRIFAEWGRMETVWIDPDA
ncbi:MAG: ABC transporter substrate-binding protein [Caldilineaceae bacterium]|uniref:ABC transporter substrate-binding protein n=1 Tax=Caldilineaceae bacterium SB0675_bin_29 TaxID=2605266 RepID=A0A6B1FZW2_9CHLR|nr:ABC transporter substrate-binding protein [Caldilineaceae bacterium]MYH61598.1 ABC transporter substrate-binding protein [Caldilineaceae bacterium SB0675_bin_29]